MPTLSLAPAWKRALAFLVDLFIVQVFLNLCLNFIVGGQEYIEWSEALLLSIQLEQPYPAPPSSSVWVILQFAVLGALFVSLFWHKKGGTPGHLLFKLKIVDKHTLAHLSFQKAILRYTVLFIVIPFIFALLPPLLTFFVAAIMVSAMRHHKQKQGLHDLACNSIIIEQPKTGISDLTQNESGQNSRSEQNDKNTDHREF